MLKHGLGTQPESGATVVETDALPRRHPLPEPGEPFGRYRVVRTLGRGGMGVVYEAEELNARSDLYSVGVTLFYLLTGRVPFEGNNIEQLTANVLEKRAPSPRRFRKDIPPGLANAVLRCLEKQSGERFRSYDELRQALAPYTSAAPTPATMGLRFLAGAVDMFFLGLLGALVAGARFGNPMDMMNLMTQRSTEMLAWMLSGLFLGMLYYAIAEGFWGATVGKAICRLRVVGSDNSPPGLGHGLARGFFYVVLPVLPYWIFSRGDPYAFLRGSTGGQYAMQFSFYVVLALLFCTVRRRNGFAAVHDLITRTRVIARTALQVRPTLAVSQTSPPALEAKPLAGPYHLLETLGQDGDVEWLVGYDLRLLRKVWVRVVPPGLPPVPAAWRNLGRAGRLRCPQPSLRCCIGWPRFRNGAAPRWWRGAWCSRSSWA